MIKITIQILIIFLLIIYYFRLKTADCESITLSLEDLKLFYEALYNNLFKITHSEGFINTYGRSTQNPAFISVYYIKILSQPKFIYEFLSYLPLRDILKKNGSIDDKLTEIEILFHAYVRNSVIEYERPIKLFFSIIFGPIFFTFMVKDIISYSILFSNQEAILQEALEIFQNAMFILYNRILTEEEVIFYKKKLLQDIGIKKLAFIIKYYKNLQKDIINPNDID